MRIALVSCVKSKRSTPSRAKDLYTSPLFAGLRRYAETYADRWYILSAKHGLLEPDRVIGPYEQTLNTMPAAARREWADEVKAELAAVLPEEAEVIVLAGERYREHLIPFLRHSGHPVSVPLQGLSFGRQLQHLKAVLSRSGQPPPGVGPIPGPRTTTASPRTAAGRRPRASFGSGRSLSDLTSRRAVLDAIAECDRLGREAFLDKYGYGPARSYFLEHEGRRYDSKAIVGVAYGFQFPNRGPLESGEFSGGQNTVQRKLEDLGFALSVIPPVDGSRAAD